MRWNVTRPLAVMDASASAVVKTVRSVTSRFVPSAKWAIAVIMIGTNNGHSAENIAGGIKAIVEELRKQKPEMKILLLGVFPRGGGVGPKDDAPAEKLNKKIPAINEIIAKLDDGKYVFYKDIGKKFLDSDGTLTRKMMPDLLHLNPEAYEIWAAAIKEDVQKLAK